MITKYEVREGTYYDSIVLMQLQKSLSELDGVADAGVVMATEANREVLRSADLPIDDVAANADDLVIVVKADSEAVAVDALGQVDALIAARKSSNGSMGEFRPKSLQSAAKMAPDAQWVLISVNGRYATSVADDALDLGKNVFLYSDNVSIEDEARLKQKAREKGLLVMGPDCGTAIINGIGFGFANRVRRGRIGVVGASGTGIQAITSALHRNGEGISQAIGTGGRDLKDVIGGITMLQGIELLAQDDETECIVIVSKPPSPAVASNIIAIALQIDKPVVINFIGYVAPAQSLKNIYFAQSLDDAAGIAIGCVNLAIADYSHVTAANGYLRGLFSGGTLAYEAARVLQVLIEPLHTNFAIGAALPLDDVMHSQAHTIIDMGEDVFTQGRLHPMMDNTLRIQRLRREAADPECGLIMLDVVLGEGSALDPASEIAPVLEEIGSERPDMKFVVVLVGTEDDPQDYQVQRERFEQAGAHVTNSVKLGAETVGMMLLANSAEAPSPSQPVNPLSKSLSAINVGLESFHDSLIDQGADSIHVEWKPPAGGNEKMMALLAKLKAASS